MELLAEWLDRVRTYSLDKWAYHPEFTPSPYQLASIGYVAVQKGLVECQLCHHSFHIQPTTFTTAGIQNHDEKCVYKGMKPKNISHQMLYLRLDEIMDSIKEKSSGAQQFPCLDSGVIEKTILSHQFTLKKVFERYDIQMEAYKITFFLHFFGWQLFSIKQQLHCVCYFCGRTLSLKNKKMVSEDIQNRKLEAELPIEKKFDVVGQHRYFCCWIQEIGEGRKGWETYVLHLEDTLVQIQELYHKEKPSTATKIRVKIDKFLDNFQVKAAESLRKIKEVMGQCESISKEIQRLGQQEDLDETNNQKSQKRSQPYPQEYILSLKQDFQMPLKKVQLNEHD